MYAVTGITGRVGGVVARTLLDTGQSVRAVVRDAAKGVAWKERGCEVALADMKDAKALTAAFTGVSGVFVLIPSNFRFCLAGRRAKREYVHQIGSIWEILAKYPFTHEMKTVLAGLILIHSWYPNECCADKDCHPVPCDEISEGENGAMHWKNLIFEGSQIRTSPDGECHVCHLLHEGRPVIPICVFTQKKPSA